MFSPPFNKHLNTSPFHGWLLSFLIYISVMIALSVSPAKPFLTTTLMENSSEFHSKAVLRKYTSELNIVSALARVVDLQYVGSPESEQPEKTVILCNALMLNVWTTGQFSAHTKHLNRAAKMFWIQRVPLAASASWQLSYKMCSWRHPKINNPKAESRVLYTESEGKNSCYNF